jgi:hypothetical protein
MEKPGGRTGVHSPNTEMLDAVAEKLARHDLEVIIGGTA